MGDGAAAGWYVAQGDPPGTLRYWDGTQWVGGPVPDGEVGGSNSPAVPWSTSGLTGAGTDYASWGQRVAAWFIDLAILLPFIIGAAVCLALASEDETSPLAVVGGLLFLAALVVSFVNSIIVHGQTGKTVGKRVMKTKLVQIDSGQPAGILRVIGRGLLSAIAGNLTFAIFVLIDLLFPLWDDKNQRIVDKAVSTVVVNDRPTSQ